MRRARLYVVPNDSKDMWQVWYDDGFGNVRPISSPFTDELQARRLIRVIQDNLSKAYLEVPPPGA